MSEHLVNQTDVGFYIGDYNFAVPTFDSLSINDDFITGAQSKISEMYPGVAFDGEPNEISFNNGISRKDAREAHFLYYSLLDLSVRTKESPAELIDSLLSAVDGKVWEDLKLFISKTHDDTHVVHVLERILLQKFPDEVDAHNFTRFADVASSKSETHVLFPLSSYPIVESMLTLLLGKIASDNKRMYIGMDRLAKLLYLSDSEHFITTYLGKAMEFENDWNKNDVRRKVADILRYLEKAREFVKDSKIIGLIDIEIDKAKKFIQGPEDIN